MERSIKRFPLNIPGVRLEVFANQEEMGAYLLAQHEMSKEVPPAELTEEQIRMLGEALVGTANAMLMTRALAEIFGKGEEETQDD